MTLTMKTSCINEEQPSVYVKVLSAGLAACVADAATFPLDTTKVRLQLQGEGKVSGIRVKPVTSLSRSKVKYRGLCHAVGVIAREEGVRGLYKGLVPGLQRQLCFSSVRLGLYDEFKDFYFRLLYKDSENKDMPIKIRLLAGVTTGALSVVLAQPTDVVKIRMQGQSTTSARIYNSSINAYKSIATEEGVRGLWKGVVPNIIRNIAVGVTEMVTYDVTKHELLQSGVLTDGIPCHFLSAVTAGFIAVIVSSPIDVVKTRYMNATPGQYFGIFNCAYGIYSGSGWTGFYKGCVPYFARICSWSIVMFLTYEQLKTMFTPKTNRKTMLNIIEQDKNIRLETRL